MVGLAAVRVRGSVGGVGLEQQPVGIEFCRDPRRPARFGISQGSPEADGEAQIDGLAGRLQAAGEAVQDTADALGALAPQDIEQRPDSIAAVNHHRQSRRYRQAQLADKSALLGLAPRRVGGILQADLPDGDHPRLIAQSLQLPLGLVVPLVGVLRMQPRRRKSPAGALAQLEQLSPVHSPDAGHQKKIDPLPSGRLQFGLEVERLRQDVEMDVAVEERALFFVHDPPMLPQVEKSIKPCNGGSRQLPPAPICAKARSCINLPREGP